MKVNPKFHYFVENKIEESEDTPYILWEEGDEEKLKTLIRENASNNEDREFLLKKLEEKGHLYINSPLDYVIRVVDRLHYRKKRRGGEKLCNMRDQLFPNFYPELWKVSQLGRYVYDYHNSLRHIKETLEELTELSKQTKEEN